MDTARRALLTGLAASPTFAASGGAKALPPPDTLGLLVSRASFGLREDEYQRARGLGYDAWLEEQLAWQSLDASAVESLISTNLPTVAMSNGQILELVRTTERLFQAVDELRAATVLRQVYSPRQLYEVMVEFWTNHFSMQHVDGAVRYFKTIDDREVVRRHALGNFGDMLRASARSPAMLFSLDNYLNVVGGPNENYARELMELHTLGADGGYTEDDVKEVARCFTGWTISQLGAQSSDVTYVFAAQRHDFNAKTVLGQALPAGQGETDGNRVLDLLIAHPSTAKYLAKKLVLRFVSDTPPQGLVDAVAATYTSSGGDIKAMLRTLLRSSEFKASADQKFKRPAELVNSAVRTLAPAASGNWIRALAEQLNTMGQLHYMWPTPDGYPDSAAYWTNTSAMLNRWNFGFALVEGTLSPGLVVDVSALVGDAGSAEQLVDALAQRLLRRALSDMDRALLIGFAADGNMSHRPIASSALIVRARELVGLLLGSAYFQYR